MSSTISQLSCFSTIHRRSHIRTRSYPCPSILPSKVLVAMSNDRRSIKTSSAESKHSLRYTADASKSHKNILWKPNSITEEYANGREIGDPIQDVVINQKRAARIHDFCFGIPFGVLVFSGGLVCFIFSRNPTTLITGVLAGGALLALSTFSLKIWRQGQSSLPFILGQAALTVALLWKNCQTFSLTKKLFPTGFFAVISAAMLCFYTYVVVSGGNPPPKNLKSSASVLS